LHFIDGVLMKDDRLDESVTRALKKSGSADLLPVSAIESLKKDIMRELRSEIDKLKMDIISSTFPHVVQIDVLYSYPQ
jgi:hypothetical protein